ncbi:MAG TPA: hypothetical protein VGH90_07640 [Chthoniobacteraceae bacterium]|jgi:hypothetical protein
MRNTSWTAFDAEGVFFDLENGALAGQQLVDIALAEFGKKEGAARIAVQRLRQRHHELLRSAVAETVSARRRSTVSCGICSQRSTF